MSLSVVSMAETVAVASQGRLRVSLSDAASHRVHVMNASRSLGGGPAF